VAEHEGAFQSPAKERRQQQAGLERKPLVAVCETKEVNIGMDEEQVAADELHGHQQIEEAQGSARQRRLAAGESGP
jgi:hypothetical protein